MDSFLGKYFLVVMAVLIGDYDYGDYAADDAPPIPSKTRARTCDMEIELFEMQPMEPEPIKGKLSNCSDRSCDKQFIVQPVLSSNLVVLAVFTDCNCTSTSGYGTVFGGTFLHSSTVPCGHFKLEQLQSRNCNCVILALFIVTEPDRY
ncbi:uncharacterized protein LOC125943412 [Dermacentor silvarum]|uniref:uncharacterized protein LOC125943412 n=1 Tax=Dermacentor silvarum TaxID=543639 RepID=UPI002100DA45|nr:uncharacterized protein LOC125943412 [Dermacentor silvarum]